MSNWPTLKSSDITNGLKKAGFQLVRQKGSHARFEHEDSLFFTLRMPFLISCFFLTGVHG
jgi:predicted RNA binding protein YcfA (HicA-like mRNA interferase family)